MPAIRGEKSKSKTRRHTRDLDQIHADIHKEKHLDQYKSTKTAEELPGLGRFYCVECAKWFESELNMTAHTKGKPHKRRVRQLKDEPYSQKEAERVVGINVDNGKKATEEEMMDEDSMVEAT